MLGFSSISEVAIAELPGSFIYVTAGVSATLALDSVTVQAEGAADVTAVTATMTLEDLASVTGTANISIEGITTTLSLGSILVWGNIIPAPGTSYTTVTPSSSPTWSGITTGSTPTWTNIDI
tara:strand:+ start:337 stop:702 length:366 start_codon:yes stop_codon:yes gene_type:complete